MSYGRIQNIQLDKREPDDPSPYLLAIWTPGKHISYCNF